MSTSQPSPACPAEFKRQNRQPRSHKRLPSASPLITLPNLKGVPASIDYAPIDIDNSRLAQIGLWLRNVLGFRGVKQPGPWDAGIDPRLIKTDLVAWIEHYMEEIRSDCLVLTDYNLFFGYSKESGEERVYLELFFPRMIFIMYCEILHKIADLDRALASLVRAAFKTLCWMNPSYTFDDVIEQYEDMAEDYLQTVDIDEDEKEGYKNHLDRIKDIPKNDRFFLRVNERPAFPEFPACPDPSTRSSLWWQWAKQVKETSGSWQEPIQYFQAEDVVRWGVEVFDPGYLTPFLWSQGDFIEDYYCESLDAEAQSGYEPVLFYPMNSESEIIESLHTIKRFFQWMALFQEGGMLSRKPLLPQLESEHKHD